MELLITLYWGTKFFLILRGTRTKSYVHWNESFGFCVWLNFYRTLLFVLLSTLSWKNVFPVLSCVYEPNFLSQKHLRERSGHSALKLKRCDHFQKKTKKTNSKLNGIFNDLMKVFTVRTFTIPFRFILVIVIVRSPAFLVILQSEMAQNLAFFLPNLWSPVLILTISSGLSEIAQNLSDPQSRKCPFKVPRINSIN